MTSAVSTQTQSATFEPRPSHNLQDARTFKGRLTFNGRSVLDEDIAFHVHLPNGGPSLSGRLAKHAPLPSGAQGGVLGRWP